MKEIFHAGIVQDGIGLHITGPNDQDNGNQYLVHFSGVTGIQSTTIGIVGDWELSALLENIKAGIDRILTRQTSTTTIGKGQLVTLRIKREEHRFDLAFKFNQQVPFGGGHPEGSEYFKLYASDSQLKVLPGLINRYERWKGAAAPVFRSTGRDWACPEIILHPTDNALANMESLREQVRSVVATSAPDQIKEHWLNVLDRAVQEAKRGLAVATCKTCKGSFIRSTGEQWKKQCVGCYYESDPVTFKAAPIKLEHWFI